MPDVNSVKKLTEQFTEQHFMTNLILRAFPLVPARRPGNEVASWVTSFSLSEPTVSQSFCLSRDFLSFAVIKYHCFANKKKITILPLSL